MKTTNYRFYRFTNGYSPVVKHSLINFLIFILSIHFTHAQAVTGIITDYGGFWKSSASSISAVKPDNNHNLLAFTWGGHQYSTGANNAVLSAHAETFIPGDWWSMNVYSYTGSLSGSLVTLGQMYDGVNNGPSVPPPSNANITDYLRDGIRGLGLGTGLSNLPSGNSISFHAYNINPLKIGDAVPDILLTQIAAPGTESYKFIDATGATVGNAVTVNYTSSVSRVGAWVADFYTATGMVLSSTYTKTERDLRVWAADLSSFGITAANYTNIRRFVVNMSGSSDFAFFAYNNESIVVTNVLQVSLTNFTGRSLQHSIQLNWATSAEINSQSFVIEKSDGNTFVPIGTMPAAGNSSANLLYNFADQNPLPGINYYRLKMVDVNGALKYSNTIAVKFISNSTFDIYPNPVKDRLINIRYSPISNNEQVTVYNSTGVAVLSKKLIATTTVKQIDLKQLPAGVYYIRLKNKNIDATQSFVIE